MRSKIVLILVVVAVLAAIGARLYFKHAAEQRAEQAAMKENAAKRARAILRVSVSMQDDSGENSAYAAWLQEELRYLLSRHGVDLAYPQGSKYQGDDGVPYALRVLVPAEPGGMIASELIGPSGQTEEQRKLGPRPATRLETVRLLATQLQSLLPRRGRTATMLDFIGNDDAETYEAYAQLAAAHRELMQQTPLTKEVAARRLATLASMEALLKKHPQFARGWGLLALSYLEIGGEDTAVLTQLAANAANRALAADAGLPDAHTALGLAAYQRGQWLAADADFALALQGDAASPAALGGLACLLVDVGRLDAAITVGQQAVAQDPENAEVRECLAYARIGVGGRNATVPPRDVEQDSAYLGLARAYALAALLEGRTEDATAILAPALQRQERSMKWFDALLKGVKEPKAVPAALRAVTRAASEESVDPLTEVICGVALQQPDFVFNRILRLHAQRKSLPLRMLWLKQTEFLRAHARFRRVVETLGVNSYWNERERPDYCHWEPEAAGCRSLASTAAVP